MRSRPRPSWALPLALALVTGCAAAPQAPLEHDAPELPLYAGERARLRTDVAPIDAERLLALLERMERALDSSFPFLASPPGAAPALCIVLQDAARFALHARDHQADPDAGALVCANGEVCLRFRPDVWDAAREGGPAVPLEPPVRPLAAAILRRRLLTTFGAQLEPTWIEHGLAAVFVELMAHDLSHAAGGAAQAVRQNRERLLDAFLPLYLGAPPALTALLSARGDAQLARAGSPALAWAAVRFLAADPQRSPLLERALRRAAGEDAPTASSPGPEWDATRELLTELEAPFEEFLLQGVLRELLIALRDAPTPVDRWEAAAALRLVANLDLDVDLPPELLARQLTGAEEVLSRQVVPTRFLDRYQGEIARVRDARSQLQAMARLKAIVGKELARRSEGYGHPAVERARHELGRALQREMTR